MIHQLIEQGNRSTPARRPTLVAACGDFAGVVARRTGHRSCTRRHDAASVRLADSAIQALCRGPSRSRWPCHRCRGIRLLGTAGHICGHGQRAAASAGHDRTGRDDRAGGRACWLAGALGLSGLVAWTLSRPEVSTDDSLVRALYYLAFPDRRARSMSSRSVCLIGRHGGAQPHPRVCCPGRSQWPDS